MGVISLKYLLYFGDTTVNSRTDKDQMGLVAACLTTATLADRDKAWSAITNSRMVYISRTGVTNQADFTDVDLVSRFVAMERSLSGLSGLSLRAGLLSLVYFLTPDGPAGYYLGVH